MIGSGTALADDPELSCRLPGLEDRSPVRIVVDGRLRMAANCRIARTARKVPTWVITRDNPAMPGLAGESAWLITVYHLEWAVH